MRIVFSLDPLFWPMVWSSCLLGALLHLPTLAVGVQTIPSRCGLWDDGPAASVWYFFLCLGCSLSHTLIRTQPRTRKGPPEGVGGSVCALLTSPYTLPPNTSHPGLPDPHSVPLTQRHYQALFGPAIRGLLTVWDSSQAAGWQTQDAPYSCSTLKEHGPALSENHCFIYFVQSNMLVTYF